MRQKRKLQFDIITIFPHIFDYYFGESIIKRAQQKKLVKINIHNLRDFTTDKHKTVDDKPFGGGPGMVLKIEPIFKSVQFLKSKIKNQKSQSEAGPFRAEKIKSKVILFSPQGKKFDQKMAQRFSKLDQIILICGRYEGVDERVAKYIADEEVSIGDYILTGGEVPAMVIVDAVSRLIPGILGTEDSIEDKRGGGYPVYTRPENFRGWKAPKVLLSGDHKKIEDWRKRR